MDLKGQNEDKEMISVTPFSNWEGLEPNDNPSDRFNCFMVTAAGLLELKSIANSYLNPKLSEYAKSELI